MRKLINERKFLIFSKCCKEIGVGMKWTRKKEKLFSIVQWRVLQQQQQKKNL